MISAEIAGYAHEGENKCTECVWSWALIQLDDMQYRPAGLTTWTSEGLLNALAGLWDVDRDYAESDDFPVPFSGAQANTDASHAAHDGDNAPKCQCGNEFTEL